jgi:hypothetical protein
MDPGVNPFGSCLFLQIQKDNYSKRFFLIVTMKRKHGCNLKKTYAVDGEKRKK